jgi:subtilase family serine protease
VLVYTSFPGLRVGWHIIGGTSASAPQLAGLIALTNQLADQNHTAHVGYLNPLLYQLPASDFNDIVPQTFGSITISNNSDLGVTGMPALAGYDLTTGFGSPKAYQFVHDLAALLP